MHREASVGSKSRALRRIDVKHGWAVDQIKFTYADGSSWSAGQDGGSADRRPAVMSAGEYLTRVTHERFVNYRCAAAGVAFETNKGRRFEYYPDKVASRRADEQVTIEARRGHEIVALRIERGVLRGVEQRRRKTFAADGARNGDGDGDDGGEGGGADEDSRDEVAGAASWPAWYAICVLDAPRDKVGSTTAGSDRRRDGGAIREEQLLHFRTPRAALKQWRAVITAKNDSGCRAAWAALLVDARERLVVDTAAAKGARGSAALRACERRAQEVHGLCAPRPTVGRAAPLEALRTLYRLLSTPRDIALFAAVSGLLVASTYFDLQASVMTAQVLQAFGAGGAGTEDDDGGSGAHGAMSHTLLFGGQWVAPESACAWLGAGTEGAGRCYRPSLLLSLVAARALQTLLYTLNVYVHQQACERRNSELDVSVLAHVLRLDQAYFDTHGLGDVRAGMQVHAVNNMISWNVPYLLTYVLKLVMIVGVLARIHLPCTVLALFFFAVARFGVLTRVHDAERTHERVQRKLKMRIDHIREDALGMISTVKMFGREERHRCEYAEAQDAFQRSVFKQAALRCGREAGWSVVHTGTFCIVLWQAMMHGRASPSSLFSIASLASLTTAELSSFFLLLRELQDRLGSVSWHYDQLLRELDGVDRLLDLLRAQPQLTTGEARPRDVGGAIEFDSVRFAYPARPGEDVFCDLSFSVPPRRTTAIVGASGCGKSTIAKLLLRLYDPDAGCVRVGGQDLRDLDLEAFRERVAIVPQNPELFECSIADNIAYGLPPDRSPTRADVVEAARLANCDGFIARMRSGYDAFAGARGCQLSAGQKQRIAIARAAVRRPALLILDEATSSLDAENERLVQQAIERLTRGCTTVIIAHRLCTIRHADEIICLCRDGGLERGDHATLMERRGAYHALVHQQMDTKEGTNC